MHDIVTSLPLPDGATTLAVLLGAVAALFLARLRKESAPEATFSSQTVAAQSIQLTSGEWTAPAVADEPGAQQSHNLSATIEQAAAKQIGFFSQNSCGRW